jgi:hypothetical protein
MAAMTTYDGPATVATEGAEHQVTAQLTTEATHDGLKEWHGTLTAQDEAAAWAIFNSNDTSLRISDDRKGSFIAGTFNADTAELRIQGSGPAPFGG